jgi:molecular chaperone Hsp33
MLADTVTDPELLTLPADRLLFRLFNEETVRLQPPLDLEFGCSCSRERTANTLRILGRAEVDDILAQEGRIEVTCEFCGANYRYDPIDARLLFEPFATGLPNVPQ